MKKISIITVNFNNLEGLKKTVESVINQTYLSIEYVVIDGGSTDGSQAYLRNNSEKFDYWVSEPDKGVYNAMNKGIRKSTGDYLLFLNSGDELFDSKVISVVESKMNQNFDIYYGNEINSSSRESILPGKLTPSFLFKTSLRHQAMFFQRDLFDEVFLYNEDLSIVSDWEFYLCAILKHNASYQHLDFLISRYEGNGISQVKENRSIRTNERQLCLERHFQPFLEDYEELNRLRQIARLDRYQMLVKLENSVLAKRINTIFLKMMNLIFN